MKYNFEGFLIGLGIFWLMTLIAYIENTPIVYHYNYFGLPLAFWIVWVIFEKLFANEGEVEEK